MKKGNRSAIVFWLILPSFLQSAPAPKAPPAIVVGINRDYPPFEFLDPSGKPQGYDVEIVQAVARTMGLNVQFRAQDWDRIKRALTTRKIQALAGMLRSPEREQSVGFSSPHLVVHYAIFVRSQTQDIATLDDLKGRRVLVERSSQMHEHLKDQGALLIPLASEPEALRTLAAGAADAALASQLEGILEIRKSGLSNLRQAGAPVASRDLCIAVAKGNQELLAAFNTGLAIISQTGEQRRIYDKWFRELAPPPLSAKIITKTILLVVLPLGALIGLIMVWNRSLRHQIRQRTRELHASNRAMREQDRFLQAIVDHAPVALFAKDPRQDFHFTAWNRKCEEINGIPRENVLGNSDYDLYDPRQAERFRATDLQTATTKRAMVIPEELLHSRTRGRVWLRSIKVPLLDESGEPWMILGISEDITQQRDMELALRQREASLTEAQALAHFGSWEWDAETERIQWSNELLRIFGLDPDQTQPSFNIIESRIHPEDQEAAHSMIQQVREHHGVASLEHRILLPGGRLRHILSVVRAKTDEQERLVRLMGTCQDITERVQTEDALRQAQKLEELGVLAGGIAHDFNNLFTAILANLSLAQIHTCSDPKLVGYLDKIEMAVEQASELTRQMLAYSGKGAFLLQPIQLNELLQSMSHLLESSTQGKAQIQFDLGPDIPPMLADAPQIRQAVLNLATNAAEAMEEGQTGTILFRTSARLMEEQEIQEIFPEQGMEPGCFILLEVTDTGSGMTADTMSHLFDPFFSTKFSGRGLGLPATLGILKSHRAGISVRSQTGQGSSFRIAFPAIQEELAALPDAETPMPPPSTSPCILLVDDEPEVRSSTAEVLQILDYTVVEAADGQEALERFCQSPSSFQLVLLDLTMPKMDGRETLAALRKIQPDVNVILYSGYHPEEVFPDQELPPHTGFLQKPFRLQELREQLDKILL